VKNLQKLDSMLISKKHRGFFAKFPEILINELFSNGKGRGPAGRAQSTMDRRRRGQRGGRSAVPRAHRSTASGRSSAPKLTGGGAIERGEHEELG
jgi:hypothetical protein